MLERTPYVLEHKWARKSLTKLALYLVIVKSIACPVNYAQTHSAYAQAHGSLNSKYKKQRYLTIN